MVSAGDGDREEDVEEGEVGDGACTAVAMGSGTMQTEDRNKYFMRRERGAWKGKNTGVVTQRQGLIYGK
jgi:hypothetical protein